MESPTGRAVLRTPTSAKWSPASAFLRRLNARLGASALSSDGLEEWMYEVGEDELNSHGVYARLGAGDRLEILVNTASARATRENRRCMCFLERPLEDPDCTGHQVTETFRCQLRRFDGRRNSSIIDRRHDHNPGCSLWTPPGSNHPEVCTSTTSEFMGPVRRSAVCIY